MAKATTPSARFDLDKIIEQRKEKTGSGHTWPFAFGGKIFDCVDPVFATEEWSDRHSNLISDLQDDLLSLTEFREELIDLFLGDQADEFRKVVRDKYDMTPGNALNFVIDARAEEQEKNFRGRRNMRSTRRK